MNACIPTAAELAAERLAELVERLNAAADPAERLELHAEVSRIRRRLACEKGAPTVEATQ
jgi:hypothetical protein